MKTRELTIKTIVEEAYTELEGLKEKLEKWHSKLEAGPTYTMDQDQVYEALNLVRWVINDRTKFELPDDKIYLREDTNENVGKPPDTVRIRLLNAVSRLRQAETCVQQDNTGPEGLAEQLKKHANVLDECDIP